MLWIQRTEATGEQLPRSVGNNLQMTAVHCSMNKLHYLMFMSIICVGARGENPRNDMFFEHFLSINIVYLSK
jgi:hypothetical protein